MIDAEPDTEPGACTESVNETRLREVWARDVIGETEPIPRILVTWHLLNPPGDSDLESAEQIHQILAQCQSDKAAEETEQRDAIRPGPRSGSDGNERVRSGPGG